MTKARWAFPILMILLVLITGCRGWRSEKPPVHPNPNLDWQPRFKAQTLSLQPPAGTVPWGREAVYRNNKTRVEYSQKNIRFFTGKDAQGNWVNRIPLTVTSKLLSRGQERFNIHCAMCHDRAGTGKGPVISRGLVPPPNFSDARIVAYSDGALFNIITDGIRTMPSYKKQISERDRWAIVGYLRALQKTRTGNR